LAQISFEREPRILVSLVCAGALFGDEPLSLSR